MDSKMFKIPHFDDIPVSTKTQIVMTNLVLDIGKLFDFLPVTPYVVIPKRRGRKKKTVTVDPNKGIPDGSIITIKFENKIRGVILKKKSKSAKKSDYFRNSVTVVMTMGGKNINFKISRNGKFQMTGCKTDYHAQNCVKHIWLYIRNTTGIYTMNGDVLKALFIPAMRNIDFGLGFNIDREKLDLYFNNETEYCSLLETSIGYTGVNIKIPFNRPITELRLKELNWLEDDWDRVRYVDFNEYLKLLKPKDRDKKLRQDRYHSFLVFHSGKIIMSSICADFAREPYYNFMNIIRQNHDRFQEKLDT